MLAVLIGEDLTAGSAGPEFELARLSAGCFHLLGLLKGVAVGRDDDGRGNFILALGVGEELAAGGALPVCLRAVFRAAGLDLFNLDKGVSLCRNHNGRLDLGFALLVGEELAAGGALPVRLRAFLGAGRGNLGDRLKAVTLSGDGFRLGDFIRALGIRKELTAIQALPIRLGARLGTGRGNLGDAFHVVALCRDHNGRLDLICSLLVGEELAAGGALPVFLRAGLGAGGGDAVHMLELVTLCGNHDGRLDLIRALGIGEELAADGTLPVCLNAVFRTGCRNLGNCLERVAAGAGIGLTIGQLDVIDGKHAVAVGVAGIGLIEVEGKLDVGGPIGLGNRDFRSALEVVAAHCLQIGSIPDGCPGAAAVGRCFHRELGDAVLDHVLEQQVIKGQCRSLIGEIHCRGHQILVLLLASACRHGLNVRVAPAPVAVVLVVVEVDAGLTGGIQVAVGADIPGAAGILTLHRPAVAGEVVLLEVVVELHFRSRLTEGGGDGVHRGDILKSVGIHCTGALAIDQDVRDFIAGIRRDDEALGSALLHGDLSARGDGAALTGGCGDGVLRTGGAVLHGKQLDVIHGHGAGVVRGVDIVESELHAVHGVLLGNRQLLRTGNHAGLLAVVDVEEVPQRGPGLAAVGGNLDRRGVGLVLRAVIADTIVEAQHDAARAGQIDCRGDQIFILLAAVPVVGNIGVLGIVDVLPVPIGLLLPGVAVGVLSLQRPAVEGEAVAADALEVVLEHHLRHVGGDLEFRRHGVVLIHGERIGAVGHVHAAAVDLDGGQLIALIRLEGHLHGLAGRYLGLTRRLNRAALAGHGGQHADLGGRGRCRQLRVIHDHRTAAGIGRLVIVEGKLNIRRLIGLRHGDLRQTRLDRAGTVGHVVLGVPDGRPGLAAVGRGLHGEGHLAVVQRHAGEAIVEGQRRFLAGQINCRGDQVLVLLVAAGVALVIILVRIHNGLLVVQTRGHVGVAGLMPVVVFAVAVGVLHRPALAGESRGVVEIIVEDGNLTACRRSAEGCGDGVIHAHALEGIIADRADIDAVDLHILDLIALVCGDLEGLARALLHQNDALGGDAAALARRSVHGDVVFSLIGVNLHIVQIQIGAALAGVNKGEAQAGAVLELLRDGDLGLGSGPCGKQAGVALEIPDLFPVLAVRRGHDLQVAVLVLDGVPVGGVEIEDHVRIGFHLAQVSGDAVEPFVLLVVVIVVDGGGVFLAAIPGIHGTALGFHAPALGQPVAVEILGPEDVGRDDIAVVVRVAGDGDDIALGVAGIVMHDHAEALAHAGNVELLDVGGRAGRGFGEALLAVEQAAVLEVVEDHRGDILVVRDVQAEVVTALGLRDLQVLRLRLLSVDGDGELPGILEVLAAAVAVGQRRLNANGRLGVVGQLGVVGIGAVPRLDAVILGVHACGRDSVVVVAVDGLADILAVLAVVDLAIRAGDGVLQALGVAQQAGIDAVQAVHKVILVGRDGVVVREVGHVLVVVVAEISIDRVLAGGGEGGVHIRLRLAGGAVERLPVIGGIHDRRDGPVAVEGEEGHAQVDRVSQLAAVLVHLLQGDPAFDIGAVGKFGHFLRIRQGDDHGDVSRLTRLNKHAVIRAVGREGVRQRGGGFGRDRVVHIAAVGVGSGLVGQNDGLDVVVQVLLAGVMYRELHGISACLLGIVLQFELRTLLSLDGDIALGIHGVGNAHQACALLTRGIGNAVGVRDDMRRAHQEGIGQMLALGGVGNAARLERLLHDGHAARHMRGGHGGAVHALIGVAGDCGVDACAGGGDFRLERQLRRCAPGGEVGHTGHGRFHDVVEGGNGQNLVLLLLHIFAGRLRDKGARHFPILDGHVKHALGVVVNQHADGARLIGVVHLLLVVDAAALDQRDLAGCVNLREVVLRAGAGNDHVLQLALLCKGAHGDGVGVLTDGRAVLIGQILARNGDEGAGNHAIGDGGDGEGLAIGGGLTDQAVVRVGGQRLAAEGIAVGRAVGVARCNRQRGAAFADLLKDVQQVLRPLVLGVVVNVAAVGAEAQVGDIDAQGDAVFQRAEDIGIGGAAGGLEDVHVDDLRLGRDAHDLVIDAGAARCRGGDVCAVAALLAGRAVLVLIAVVELEGELCALVKILRAQTGDDIGCLELLGVQKLLQIRLRQCRRGRILGEDLVGHVHTGIQNGDEHALAVEAGLIIDTAADHAVAVCGCGDQLKGRGDERGFHAVQIADLLILAVGHGRGEAVEERRILMLRLYAAAAHGLLGNLLHSLVLLLQQRLNLCGGLRGRSVVAHNHDDLDFVVFIVARRCFHLDFFILFPAAAQDLLCNIRSDVRKRGFFHGSQLRMDRSIRGSKRRAGNDRQQHYQRQNQRTAAFECCHLVFLLLFNLLKEG